jgi:hypothetical protein
LGGLVMEERAHRGSSTNSNILSAARRGAAEQRVNKRRFQRPPTRHSSTTTRSLRIPSHLFLADNQRTRRLIKRKQEECRQKGLRNSFFSPDRNEIYETTVLQVRECVFLVKNEKTSSHHVESHCECTLAIPSEKAGVVGIYQDATYFKILKCCMLLTMLYASHKKCCTHLNVQPLQPNGIFLEALCGFRSIRPRPW